MTRRLGRASIPIPGFTSAIDGSEHRLRGRNRMIFIFIMVAGFLLLLASYQPCDVTDRRSSHMLILMSMSTDQESSCRRCLRHRQVCWSCRLQVVNLSMRHTHAAISVWLLHCLDLHFPQGELTQHSKLSMRSTGVPVQQAGGCGSFCQWIHLAIEVQIGKTFSSASLILSGLPCAD